MKYLLFLIFPVFYGCQTEKVISKYPAQVGDIQFDKNTDEPLFKKCGEAQDYSFQYYNFGGIQYEGEKITIQRDLEKLNISGDKNLNSYLTIRFVVNCEGKTGMFRIDSMDFNYKKMPVDQNLGDQLLNFTQSLKGWVPKKAGNHPVDYYQYLTFKIEHGKISEILP